MCQTHAPHAPHAAADDRADAGAGQRLEDGAAAHAHDHAAWSRRDFLQRLGLATVGAGFLAGANPVGVFARAPVLDLLSGIDTDRVLVLVQLSGGNDGLNTLVPVDNDVYYQKRPVTSGATIAIPKASAIALGGGFGLHPSLAPLVPMWGAGNLALVHSVGYASQSRSHFESGDNWMTGSGSGLKQTDGWVGRFLLDRLDEGQTAQHYRENPPAVSLGSASRLFDTGEGNLGIGALSYTTTTRDLLARGAVYPTDNIPAGPYENPLRYIREQVNVSLAYVVRFVDATTRVTNRATYPAGTFASNLALAARIVRGGLSPRILSVTLGGFDTHAGQGGATGTHATRLAEVASGLRAFFDDLAADGLDRRVVAMTFSEFGRTLASNGSGGTDHGSASPVFVAGPAVEGGFFGTAPNLVTDLDRSAPGATTDYRSLYATLLERWFGVPEADVDALLGGVRPRVGILAPTATAADGGDVRLAAPAILAPTPNPFTDRATLRLRLPAPMPVRVVLFDAAGRRVAVLHDGPADAGEWTLPLDGTALAPGMYVVRMETPRGSVSRAVVRVR